MYVTMNSPCLYVFVCLCVFILKCNRIRFFSFCAHNTFDRCLNVYRWQSSTLGDLFDVLSEFPAFRSMYSVLFGDCDECVTKFENGWRLGVPATSEFTKEKKIIIISLIYLTFNRVSGSTRCIGASLLSFAWFRLIFD